METTDFDYNQAKKWFTRLKKVMNAMPTDCELLVSGWGVMTLMPQGSVASEAGSEYGMDRITEKHGVFEFCPDRVIGENSSI